MFSNLEISSISYLTNERLHDQEHRDAGFLFGAADERGFRCGLSFAQTSYP